MSEEQAQSSEPEKPKPKLCIDCAHVASSVTFNWYDYKCLAPENIREVYFNLVTGEDHINYKSKTCEAARHGALGGCGQEAKWFKQREPLGTWIEAELINGVLASKTPKAGGKPQITVDMI